jgi:hypothetical protein
VPNWSVPMPNSERTERCGRRELVGRANGCDILCIQGPTLSQSASASMVQSAFGAFAAIHVACPSRCRGIR